MRVFLKVGGYALVLLKLLAYAKVFLGVDVR